LLELLELLELELSSKAVDGLTLWPGSWVFAPFFSWIVFTDRVPSILNINSGGGADFFLLFVDSALMSKELLNHLALDIALRALSILSSGSVVRVFVDAWYLQFTMFAKDTWSIP
jgi:hypothetical protein